LHGIQPERQNVSKQMSNATFDVERLDPRGSKNVELNIKLKQICNIGKFECECGYL